MNRTSKIPAPRYFALKATVGFLNFMDGWHAITPLLYDTKIKQKALHVCAGPIVSTGSFLSSQTVSSPVLSAFKGLTSVFGMGTGGSPQLSPPDL